MRHADEGTLHSFLDRELSPVEVEELERHLSVCVPCRALLAEARTFMADADELVVALDVHPPRASVPTVAIPARGWRPRPA
ncbi:MAG: zf-HC2 domain-containing protein, partial [Gemmatimonadales bacterium]